MRCGVFVPGPARRSGPAAGAPIVWFGSQVRDRMIIRLLAVERGVRGLLIIALAAVVVQVRGSQDTIEDKVTQTLPMLKELGNRLAGNITDSKCFTC